MKKTLLVIIHDLDAGGAQKSLISFLNTMPPNLYEISLMPIDFTGIFTSQIPQNVKLLSAPLWMKAMMAPITGGAFLQKSTIRFIPLKIVAILLNLLFRDKRKASRNQYTWKIWKRFFGHYKHEFDIAMSYMDGFCNYYVVDRVKSRKKILWIHNDYNKLPAVPKFDTPYFNSADYVVTISETCRESLVNNFPDIAGKLKILANISSQSMITKMSKKIDKEDGYFQDQFTRILSIGRLCHQKGFDLAIEVAAMLKARGYRFTWYIIGDGPDKKMLDQLIVNFGVGDVFILLGIRNNPYPFIAQADIFVQPSRYEGKSIVLDEAKILCKPIIVTDYPTAKDSIENGVDGYIVPQKISDMTDTLETFINDKTLRVNLSKRLSTKTISNEKEILKYIEIL